jgi:hypothetical protein
VRRPVASLCALAPRIKIKSCGVIKIKCAHTCVHTRHTHGHPRRQLSALARTHIHSPTAHTHTHAYTHTRTRTRTHSKTEAETNMHKHVHTHAHSTCAHARTHADLTHASLRHTREHTRTPTRRNTESFRLRAHAQTHTHSHTYALARDAAVAPQGHAAPFGRYLRKIRRGGTVGRQWRGRLRPRQIRVRRVLTRPVYLWCRNYFGASPAGPRALGRLYNCGMPPPVHRSRTRLGGCTPDVRGEADTPPSRSSQLVGCAGRLRGTRLKTRARSTPPSRCVRPSLLARAALPSGPI